MVVTTGAPGRPPGLRPRTGIGVGFRRMCHSTWYASMHRNKWSRTCSSVRTWIGQTPRSDCALHPERALLATTAPSGPMEPAARSGLDHVYPVGCRLGCNPRIFAPEHQRFRIDGDIKVLQNLPLVAAGTERPGGPDPVRLFRPPPDGGGGDRTKFGLRRQQRPLAFPPPRLP